MLDFKMSKICRFRRKTFVLFLLVCIETETCLAQEQPEVTIDQGTLLGSVATSRDGRPFYKFLGIPYGKVNQPFEISHFADGWNGTRLATEYTPGCLQFNYTSLSVFGTEDCLDLDIYTPKLPSDLTFNASLPVIVYIFGGGFYSGTSSIYQGDYFVDEDVILVVPNYRLGPYGFLNVGIEEARGNQGLKDQVLALKWVRDNIEKFGGDPSKVTIMGESAGSTSVSLHSVSPMAKGLFSQVIAQSGGAACPNVFTANPGEKFAKLLAAAVDCPTRDVKNLVNCLKNTSTTEVLTAFAYSTSPEVTFADNLDMLFGPTYETFSSGQGDPNVYLTEHPFLAMMNGNFERVPMILGQVSHEAFFVVSGLLQDSSDYDKFNREFGRTLPAILLYGDASDDPCVISGRIKEHFLNGRNVTSDDFYLLESFFADRMKTHCLRKMAHEYSKHTPVYMYNFTHHSSLITPDRPPSHGDELQYLFLLGAPFDQVAPPILIGDVEYELSKNMVRLWANFAKDGKPGTLWGTLEGVEWAQLVPEEVQKWLQIDDEPQFDAVDKTFEDLWKFWDNLPLKEYERVE